ncbi:MAG: DUF1565 domain-containing protein, partial [Deltaproteobacteria bacterium]|nr:DUF1565 domain-containing protein [Deltaproteobacteria bacterium]
MARRGWSVVSACLMALGVGCADGGEVILVDAGPADTEALDAEALDAGALDTGPVDTGPVDTGCQVSPDSCPADQHCDGASGRCVSGCHADEGCPRDAEAARCDTGSHTCVRCVSSDHCPAGNLCVGNLCVTGCTAERGCTGTQTCCGGACVDTQANVASCGACDRRCAVPNATPACLNGMCTVGSCSLPFGDCDRDAATGCETNTFTSVFHCGGCDRACEARAHATAVCTAGSCAYTCEAGFSDCDGNPGNGCETDSNTSTTSCGACGAVCMPARAMGACVAGRCTISACGEGYGDCDGNAGNGCETDLNQTSAHCGACGRACGSRPNSFPGCIGGECQTSCVTGFLDCDGDDATGCETNVRTSLESCGACGRTCATANAAPACVAARCTISRCDAGFADCNASVTDGCEARLATDGANCGACGNRCPTGTNQVGACVAGACALACAPGYVDLDAVPGNGCECRSTDADVPDDGFADTNCDGIDGNAARAVFVSTRGNDAAPGTREAPKRTIGAAIAAATPTRFAVYIAGGTYSESITLASGVSLYGGYNDSGWTRAASNVTTIDGGATAVRGAGLSAALELNLLTIRAANASGAGQSSYGVRLAGSGALVTLHRCAITAGNGVPGVDGAAGAGGAAGGNASGITAGSSACGGPGGAGGA